MNYPEYLHVRRMLEKAGQLEELGFTIAEAKQPGKEGQFQVLAPEQYRNALPAPKICAHFEEAVAFAAGMAAGLGLVLRKRE